MENKQEETQEVVEQTTETNAEQTTEEQPSFLSKYRWHSLAVVVILILGIAGFAINSDGDEPVASQESTAQTEEIDQNETPVIEEIGLIRSFDDCIAAGFDAELIDDTSSCTDDSGRIFFADSEGNSEGETDAEPGSVPTVNDADQSVSVTFGADDSSYYTTMIPDGSSTVDIVVNLALGNLEYDACSLTLEHTPDNPALSASVEELAPQAQQTVQIKDGLNVFSATCQTESEPLTNTRSALIRDRLPEQCANFEYSAPSQSSASSLSDFQSEIVGTWEGCVDLPWWATYNVTITFNEDGSYNASSAEELDGNISEGGFYQYSIAGENASKLYGVESFQNDLGQGFLDIVHPNGTSVQRGELRNIRLNDNALMFDFYHQGKYGPLTFSLNRQ